MINTSFNNSRSGILSVSQLNFYIKSLMDSDMKLSGVFISGEISNLTDHYKSGHIYLSLKDEKSIIRGVMFAGNAARLKFRPENGMKVIARGRVSVYEATGQYQLYIDDMQPYGAGALAVAFEQLKAKLEKEGLFHVSAKKAIPMYPKTVGIITSPTGAAIEDMKSILVKRWPIVNILIYPSLVQGEEAPKQLIKGINYFSKKKCADVVIIGRGGGSAEDLWAFNSEELARAIYACEVPVISAVGHETDFTICDFVADIREHTPSAAAKRAVPDIFDERNKLSVLEKSLNVYARKNLAHRELYFEKLKDNMADRGPAKALEKKQVDFDDLAKRFYDTEKKLIEEKENSLKALEDKLSQLDPEKTLMRGYAAVEKDGVTVNSVKQVAKGDRITITLADGSFKALVE